MKKYICLLAIILFPTCPLFSDPLKLTIVYPREGAKMPFLQSSFVFGSVSPSSASLWINGTTVTVYPSGSYLAMIPFKPGEFKIHAKAQLGEESAQVTRSVLVASPSIPLPSNPLQISLDSIQPSTDTVVVPGDILPVRFKGTPNAKAEYRFRDFTTPTHKKEWNKIAERSPLGSGIYETFPVIETDDRASHAFIEFKLTNSAGKSVKASSLGKIKIADDNSFMLTEVSTDEVTLRTGPSIDSDLMGYTLFLTRGVKLKARGKVGSELRVKLSDHLTAWVDEKCLKSLPQNSLLPRAVLDNIRMQSKGRSLVAVFDLKEKIPYRILVSNDLKVLTLTLFYTVSNIDRIRYDEPSSEKWLRQIRWFQPSQETVDIQFELKNKIWGYDLHYDGSKLICEIVFPPAPAPKKLSPLDSLTIALDPGHSFGIDEGAISPQGIPESEINFKIATCLKEKLEALGAEVVLTRNEKEVVGLQDRGKKAWQARADLFVSIHANAVPDGTNPFDRRGYSVFYFQPQSFELAKFVHSAYDKISKLNDDGFYYGNLAVCRVTQMPAILTESEYLIRPDGEALLLSKEFQCRAAQAMAEGIVRFVQSDNRE